MKTWYVKAFAELTKISVRTLHHYDEIGLLRPALRTESGYRLYSEYDLFKLEQIAALKFFGFRLKQIMKLVSSDKDLMHHLNIQKACLSEQITQINRAYETLSAIIAESSAGKQIEWSKIVTLIEVYHMTEDLKKTWAGQVYSPDQLKQFAEMKTKFTDAQIKDIENRWAILIEKVKNNINQNPTSPIAQQLAQEWMALVNEQYAGFDELKEAVSLAYKHNKIPNAPFDKELWDFLHKAVMHLETNNKK